MPKTVGCSIVRVGYSILWGISLTTGDYINTYDVMNLIEAGPPVCDRILFSSSGIHPQVTETPLQNNNNNNKDKEITIPYYTTQDSLVLPMLNQSICDRRFTSNWGNARSRMTSLQHPRSLQGANLYTKFAQCMPVPYQQKERKESPQCVAK